MNAPIAPTAPKARYSTPVARYKTTSPTPDRAYTPPRARPLTRNCSSSDQLGIYLSSAGRRRVGGRGAGLRAVRLHLRVVLGDQRAAAAARRERHLPVVRRGRVVHVVRQVTLAPSEIGRAHV